MNLIVIISIFIVYVLFLVNIECIYGIHLCDCLSGSTLSTRVYKDASEFNMFVVGFFRELNSEIDKFGSYGNCWELINNNVKFNDDSLKFYNSL
jgi:hypothetical protein